MKNKIKAPEWFRKAARESGYPERLSALKCEMIGEVLNEVVEKEKQMKTKPITATMAALIKAATKGDGQ